MVKIAPFRALRYTRADIASLTSPPHDVLTDAERDAFIAADTHNICELTLPRGDDSRYQACAATLKKWQTDGTIARDDKPAYYLYEVRHDGGTMTGFFCRIAVDPDYETIRRHEHTLPKKRSDRLEILRTTDTNLESIWMLYRDERGWVEEVLRGSAFDELARFQDEEGMEHVLWRVDRPEAVEEVTAQFDDRTVVIADGHHRYATQLKRWQETGKDTDGSLMVCLVRDSDPGLSIRPTDRLVIDVPFPSLSEGIAGAQRWSAEAMTLPEDDTEAAAMLRGAIDNDPKTITVAGLEDGKLLAWTLRLRDDVAIDQGRGTLDRLAVTILHDHLLQASWGFVPENVEDHIKYTRSDVEAVQRVRSGEFPAVVLLAGEPVSAVLDVASEGHLMPQKATYFVPKLRSGLLMSPCDEPLPTGWAGRVTDPGKADFRLPDLS